MLSKGLSIVFSNTSVQKHQYWYSGAFMVQLSHLYMTTGKTTDLTDLCIVGTDSTGRVEALTFDVPLKTVKKAG